MNPPEEPTQELQPQLLELIEALQVDAAAVLGCADARAWALSPAERVRAVERLASTRRVADAAHLALVRSLTPQDATELEGTSVPRLLAWRLRIPPARAARDVAAAHATDPENGELRQVGAALGAGQISAEHVDVAVRALDHLPTGLRREHAGGVDSFLAEQSRRFRPGDCERLAGHILDRLDPARADGCYDPDAHARRCLTLTTDRTGMVLVRGQLDPVAGAQLKAAVEHYAAPAPATHVSTADATQTIPVRDERTPGQRRADALGVLARQALAPGAGERRGGEPPRILIHASIGQLLALPGAGRATCEQTGPLDPVILRRLTTAATLQAALLAPSGAVLRLGRSTRCITPAQRRALLVRDGGCVLPHCDAPAAQLEGHHVSDWAAGGATDLDNLVLACGPHHTTIGAGT